MHLGYDCSICHIFVPHRRREKGKENEGIELNFYANFCFFFLSFRLNISFMLLGREVSGLNFSYQELHC